MKSRYVATDLEFDSAGDLSHIVDELGERVAVHLNQWVEDVYRVALGMAGCDKCPEEDVAHYCSLLENLSDNAMVSWGQCTRRVVDVAFESGSEPKCRTYQLPAELVRRLSHLGLSVSVTIYQAGFYSEIGDD